MTQDNRNNDHSNKPWSSNRSNNGYSSTWNRSGNNNRGFPQMPSPVQAAKLPDEYVDAAENVMRAHLTGRNKISTSKIRNLLGMVSPLYDKENLSNEKELSADSITGLDMMRIRAAYECGRDDSTKDFVIQAKILEYLKGIQNRSDLIRFYHYMEALVAYHRYLGGKEN